MVVKFSEMCAVRTDLAGRVQAAFDNYLEAIARGYADYLRPALADGESELDVRHQLVLLRRKVYHHRRLVDNLDEGVLEQIHGDEKVRAELEARTEAVDGKLRLVRSAYRGFYGLNNLGRVGLEGAFPRGAVRLHRHAVVVKTSLQNPDLRLLPLLELPIAAEEGEDNSVAALLGAQLDPEVSRLGELLDERHDEQTKSTDARLRRQQVIREFDYNVRGIVRMAQGMFRLAGREDLALRIRPILRRVLRKLDDQEAKEKAEAEASDNDESPAGGEAETGEAAAPEETTA